MRQSRKLEHLKYTMALNDGPGNTGFEEFHLVHNCLPDLVWDDVDLKTMVAGVKIKHPVIINAITGGAADVAIVNERLAELACRSGAAMAVGSQFSALENPEVLHSYEIVRKVNPNGVIFANLGAHTTPDQARRAVEMIGASALQIHLNVAQELIMPEGDRDFRGYLDNIAAIAADSQVPVIVKEVGCGIALEQAKALVDAGVKAVDAGGRGGTNFLAIEAARGNNDLADGTLNWGIGTAISAVEIMSVLPDNVDLIVSGGIRSSLDAVKALTIGGRAVGIAGPVVKMLKKHGLDIAEEWLKSYLDEIKRYMVLLGAAEIRDLSRVPLVITGFSREWLNARGVDIEKYVDRH
ncbi:MAG: fni 1 [Firmicutes bacterium]|nr:fni 1 [Bacillota bacterium]